MSQSTKLIFSWVIRILISALFLVSAYAKIYHDPSAYFSITTFEAKQLENLKKEIENFDVILIMSNKDSKKISEPIIDLIKSK